MERMERRVRMMMLLLGLPMLVLATVNCGDSPAALCSKFYTVITAKLGDCGTVENKQSECEQNIEKCSAEDRAKLNTAITCVEKAEVCAKSNGLAGSLKFVADLGACTKPLESTSEECRKGLEVNASVNP